MNRVIAGDYKGQCVTNNWRNIAVISVSLVKPLPITKDTVEEYEVIDATGKVSSASAVGRAAVGSFFLGPVGLAAGLGAKRKGYQIAIQFKDGKRSLLEVDNKIFKTITAALF